MYECGKKIGKKNPFEGKVYNNRWVSPHLDFSSTFTSSSTQLIEKVRRIMNDWKSKYLLKYSAGEDVHAVPSLCEIHELRRLSSQA